MGYYDNDNDNDNDNENDLDENKIIPVKNVTCASVTGKFFGISRILGGKSHQYYIKTMWLYG